MEIFKEPSKNTWNLLVKRPALAKKDLETTVASIFQDIELNGNFAVKKYTKRFDGIETDSLMVTQIDFAAAERRISKSLKDAINLAKKNIEKFHAAQKTDSVIVETTAGVLCWQEKRPIAKVGLYIPAGSAPLFSTILMLAVPAQLAGCKEMVLCSPPNKNGKIDDAILYTARLCGITSIHKVGGIQAIAAMTFGTETIPAVFKLFGPGNQFVTAAKQMATKYGVAIDMPAGPSELLVYADESANASYVAADLLSQAEHGADSQVILVGSSTQIVQKVIDETQSQLQLITRKDIAEKALQHAKFICLTDAESAIEFINSYAPEHLILATKNEDYFTTRVQNAGSVFIGNYSPESAGDYASGTNHTLPTNGHARQYSGVNLDSFLKAITFQKISKKGLTNIGPSIEIMAEAEGLQAHKNAITIRLKNINRNE